MYRYSMAAILDLKVKVKSQSRTNNGNGFLVPISIKNDLLCTILVLQIKKLALVVNNVPLFGGGHLGFEGQG